MVVNRSNVYQGSSVSCYVTYSKSDEAYRCIEMVDGCILNDRVLRASFGTTKYCSYFLRNRTCTNPDCMYLHELGDDKDSFTKEDMQAGKHLARVPPPQTHHQTSRSHGLPPPRNTLRSSMAPTHKSGSPLAVPSSSASTASNATTSTSNVSASPSASSSQPTSSMAWKTQSVGPSQTQFEMRRNEMGEQTTSQKIALNTATLIQQYDDPHHDDDEDDDNDDELSYSDEELHNSAENANLALTDDTAFPALGRASTSTHQSSQDASHHMNSPHSSQSANTAKIPLNVARASQTTHSTSSSPPTATQTQANTNSAALATKSSATNTANSTQNFTSAPRHHHGANHATDEPSPRVTTNHQQNSHGKPHWHAKEKPVWQPKKSADPAPASAATPASTNTTTQVNSNSTSASSTEVDSTSEYAKNAKSPWKSTPTPTAVSISELHKMEADKAAQAKTTTPTSSAVAAKSSILPATASWASSQTAAKPSSPRSSITSNSSEPESTHQQPTEKISEKKEAPVASAPLTQTTSNTQTHTKHVHQQSRGGKGKAAAAYAKVQLAPPKEPVFDTPAPASNNTASQTESKRVDHKSEDAATSSQKQKQVNSIVAPPGTSTDDDLPPISFVPGSGKSSYDSIDAGDADDTNDEDEHSGAFPAYLMSEFAPFPSSSSASSQNLSSGVDANASGAQAISSAQTNTDSGDRFDLYSGGIASSLPIGLSNTNSSAINPIGSPLRQQNSGAASTSSQGDASGANASSNNIPMSFSLLASDMWNFGNAGGISSSNSGSVSASGNTSAPWSSFGTNNLFSPYPASSGGVSGVSSASSWGMEANEPNRSRFAFASASDPQLPSNSTNSLSSSGSTAIRSSTGVSGGYDLPPGIFPGSSASPGPNSAPTSAPSNPQLSAQQQSQQAAASQAPQVPQQLQSQMHLNFLFQHQQQQQQQQHQQQQQQQKAMQQHMHHHGHHPMHHGGVHFNAPPPPSAWSWFQPGGGMSTSAMPGAASSSAGGAAGGQEWGAPPGASPSPTLGLQQGQSILSVLSAGMNASNPQISNPQAPVGAPIGSGIPQQQQTQSTAQQQQQQMQMQQRYGHWPMQMPTHGQFMGFGDYPPFHPVAHPQSSSHPEHHQQQ